ncbi:MAG: DUF2868 domain-containing protein, partial [Alcaligenaceae bacterium]|nr:DUF2868 domain-containing protein [Alcaligenaceae bacterium]
HAVGAWPSLLGFPIPDSGIVQASDGLHALPAIAQADWSIWLIGCVVAWGLLPRLIAGLLCLAVARRRLRRLTIDPGLPGWLELRERLMPRHRPAGIDAPAPTPDSVNARAAPRAGPGTGPMALLGMELAPDTPWPPPGTPSDVRDLGVCDSRSDRRRVVQDIQPPPERLLVVYDARQTPDRGTRAWLAELRQICPHTDALLLNRPAREAMWREAFDAQGIALVPSLADWARRDTP